LINKIKWFFQRLFRGYSDPDVWSFYDHMVAYALPRLEKLKEIQHGYPPSITEEEWDRRLDLIIEAFRIMVSGDCWQFDAKKRTQVEIGIYYFGFHFFDLWD